MKLLHSLTIAFLITLIVSTPAVAADKKMLSHFQKKHELAVQSVLTCFATGADRGSWSNAIISLVQAEQALITYGLDYRSERLYGRFGKGLSPEDYPEFGWRIFQRRLEKMGFIVETPTATISNRSYKIHEQGECCSSVSIQF